MIIYASQITQTAEIHGDVYHDIRAKEGQREVSSEESGEGIRSQANGWLLKMFHCLDQEVIDWCKWFREHKETIIATQDIEKIATAIDGLLGIVELISVDNQSLHKRLHEYESAEWYRKYCSPPWKPWKQRRVAKDGRGKMRIGH